jgi:fatty acid amide hydrolase
VERRFGEERQMGSLIEQGAAELAARIAAKEVSSREVLEAHIERAEAVNPVINAVIFRMYERARAEAEAADEAVARGDELGPLHGVPMSIKDEFLVEDTPTTWGLAHRVGHRATREGPILQRLRRAGAIPFLKTNIPVMLLQTETHNPTFGRTNNPWDLERTPGGSSGGEGALIASLGSPLGIGADIGGSLRVPAHYNGIATIKVTEYRLPHGDRPEDIPAWQENIVSMTGPLARTVEDVVLGLRVMADERGDALPREPHVPPVAWQDPKGVDVADLRVGLAVDDGGIAPAPAVRRAVEEAAAALEDAGATIVEWRPPDAEETFSLFAKMLGGDGFRHAVRLTGDDPLSDVLKRISLMGRVPGVVGRGLGKVLRAVGNRNVAVITEMAGTLSVDELGDWLARRQQMLRRLAKQFHDDVDVVVCPPHALPALPHGRFNDMYFASTFTFLANLTGLPAGVVPVTRVQPDEECERSPGLDLMERVVKSCEQGSAGLPVGVQVLAGWWRDDLVLAAMAAIEQRVDGVGHPRVPGVD